MNYCSTLHRIGMLFQRIVLCAAVFSIVSARTNQNFNLGWKFERSDVSGAENPSFNDAAWDAVSLPHGFDYNNYFMPRFQWRGVAWYRKTFTVDASWEGKKVFLVFEGAMTVAEVWVNGNKRITHSGGFLPFTIDITNVVEYGSTSNVVAMKLDNTYKRDVPPEKPDGSNYDFLLFGGLYRDVKLIITENLYIPDALSGSESPGGGTHITTPQVSTSSATIQVKTVVQNDYASTKTCVLKTVILDENGTEVTSMETSRSIPANSRYTFDQTSSAINNPSLWSPTSPTLYTATAEVYDNTTLVDTLVTRFGIRSIRFDPQDGFYLNGEPLKLLGLNRHQTYPYIGGAVPNQAQVRDARILKEMGCNYVRCSHYPQDPAFMDALDELGLLCWAETPTWMNYNFSNAWKTNHYKDIRDLIRRDRNHPCIIVWSVGLNEGTQDNGFENECQTVAKNEWPAMYTASARNYTTSTNPFDIYGHNSFTGLPNSIPASSSTGYINSEYTGHTYITARYNPAAHLAKHTGRHETMVDLARDRDWCAGGSGWCAFDYNSRFGSATYLEVIDGDSIPGNGVCYHGVSDLFRIPKFAYYFYQAQAAADNYDGSKNPMVFIESHADYSMPSTQTIKVLSNCDQVELFVNDESQGTRSPDGGTSLAHPPFTFSNIRFESPGMLRADGKINGNVVATHTVRRPGSPVGIVLTSDTDILTPDGADVAIVRVSVVDDNGTVVPTARHTIAISRTGPGSVICGANGPAASGSIDVEAGQLAFLVKAGLEEGAVIVTGSASGLTEGRDTIIIGIPTARKSYGTSSHKGVRCIPAIKSVQGKLTVYNLESAIPTQIMVIAMNGRILKRIQVKGKESIAMHTGKFPAGIFTVQLTSGGHRIHRKVLFLK